MSTYQFTALSADLDCIRLLSLLPSADAQTPVHCELFEFTLHVSDPAYQPYEALSYVWGGDVKPRSIVISGQKFHVTDNLYAALSRLRHRCIPRLLWIDAICINQQDQREKEAQIRFMTVIYAKASRVLVWLGEAYEDSDEAMETIRHAGVDSQDHAISASVVKFLNRAWFRRIWVIQEVAAARHILVLCGYSEIDGHAFCAGLESIPEVPGSLAFQVTRVMRNAAFRSADLYIKAGRVSLKLLPIGQLIDLYGRHEASKPHDRIFAMLGMSSDEDLSSLQVDYSTPMNELLENLVSHVLGSQVSIKPRKESSYSVFIESRGLVLGQVTEVGRRDDSFEMTLARRPRLTPGRGYRSLGDLEHEHWTFPVPAESIQPEDIVFLCDGAVWPTIIRDQGKNFRIITMAVRAPAVDRLFWSWNQSFMRQFSMIWDFTPTSTKRKDATLSVNVEAVKPSTPEHAVESWTRAQLYGDLGNMKKAQEFRELADKAQGLATDVQRTALPAVCDHVLLLWASEYGHTEAVRSILAKGVVFDALDWASRSPLWLASARGHVKVVALLLENKVDVNACDIYGVSPLYAAVGEGFESIVALLLACGADSGIKVNMAWNLFIRMRNLGQTHTSPDQRISAADRYWKAQSYDSNVKSKSSNWTALQLAAASGHEGIVKQLLKAGNEVDSDTYHADTPLLLAIKSANVAVVQILLTAGARVDMKGSDDFDPLWVAATQGSVALIKALVGAGADVARHQNHGRLLLKQMVLHGSEEGVGFLLEAGAYAETTYGALLDIAIHSTNFGIFKLLWDDRLKRLSETHEREDLLLLERWLEVAQEVGLEDVT